MTQTKQNLMHARRIPIAAALAISCIASLAATHSAETAAKPARRETIKAYCLDFNWAGRQGFADPGTWKDADPKAHVAWHKAMGVNVIQTFCVSSNGWAWYKGGPVPVQPGLKHDFLREVVKLGHEEGMRVMGYFCIAANTRWGQENPVFFLPFDVSGGLEIREGEATGMRRLLSPAAGAPAPCDGITASSR